MSRDDGSDNSINKKSREIRELAELNGIDLGGKQIWKKMWRLGGKKAIFFFKNHACFDKIYMLLLNIRT